MASRGRNQGNEGAPKRDYGSGSVYQRADGRWVAQVVTSTSPRRVRRRATPRTENTKKAALALLTTMQREVAEQRDMKIATMTLTTWMQYYLNKVRQVHEKAANTQRDYAYLCEYVILPELGGIRMEALTYETLERWRARRRAEYAASVVKRAARLLAAALATAHARRGILFNPAHQLGDFTSVLPQPTPLSHDETTTLLTLVPHYRIGIAVACAVRLGLRVGEALGLRWSDYNAADRTMTVARKIRGGKERAVEAPKGGNTRVLPVPPGLAALLDAQRPVGGIGYLCPAEGSARPTAYRNAVRALAAMFARAGIAPRGWHQLRHTLGARLPEVGAPESVIGAVFGHTGGSVTARYSHAQVEALRAWLEAAERGAIITDIRKQA